MSKVVRALALCILASSPLAGQVGHDPAHSPYRPILLRTTISVVANYIWGSAGKLGVGPSDGPGVMLRFETPLTGPTDLTAAIGWSNLQRLIADPDAPAEQQITGPVDQGVLFTEAGIVILLTGDKTWNRIAPYVGATLGLAWGEGAAQDTSGYSFSTKFVSGPLLGLRLYAAGALSLRVEGRLQFWKVSYPTSYFVADEGEDPLLNPLVDSDSEWTTHPTLMVGLGYAFRL